ncbi:MAG: amidohydrolase [Paludibacteraceae bacterium]
MNPTFDQLIEHYANYTRDVYRHLHANPELSYQEIETSAYIRRELASMNIPFRAGIAGTGILGVIEGKNPKKKIIALRADMDALPVEEKNNVPYKSKNANVMHACGHDAHTACLLGVAQVLNQLKTDFEGTVLLIFQPGEEKAPGGAFLMLQDGIFNEYKPQMIIAQHVSVDYPTGTLAFLPEKLWHQPMKFMLRLKVRADTELYRIFVMIRYWQLRKQ